MISSTMTTLSRPHVTVHLLPDDIPLDHPVHRCPHLTSWPKLELLTGPALTWAARRTRTVYTASFWHDGQGRGLVSLNERPTRGVVGLAAQLQALFPQGCHAAPPDGWTWQALCAPDRIHVQCVVWPHLAVAS